MDKERKDSLIRIGKEFRNAGLREQTSFQNMMNNLSYLSTMEIYDTIWKILLIYNKDYNKIDMIPLVELGSDFKEGKIKEEEFKQGLQMILV